MGHRGEVEPDSILAAETLEHSLGEVRAIVSDDFVWVPVAVDESLKEGADRLAVQLLDRLGLDPFGELVHRHEKVGQAAARRPERAYHVEALEGEWPSDGYGPKGCSRCVFLLAEALAASAVADHPLGVCEGGWTIETIAHVLGGDGSRRCVVASLALVDILQQPTSFCQLDAVLEDAG